MTTKQKKFVFPTLIILMTVYVGWVFYLSEPKYQNNPYHKIEQFDYVSVLSSSRYSFEDKNSSEYVNLGLVLQVDSSRALVKLTKSYDNYIDIGIGNGDYRIIGK